MSCAIRPSFEPNAFDRRLTDELDVPLLNSFPAYTEHVSPARLCPVCNQALPDNVLALPLATPWAIGTLGPAGLREPRRAVFVERAVEAVADIAGLVFLLVGIALVLGVYA